MIHVLLGALLCGAQSNALQPAPPPGTSPAPAPAPGAASPAGSAAPAGAPASVEPWQGTFEEGFAALARHTEMREFATALEIAASLEAPHSFARWKQSFAREGGWRAALCGLADPLLDAAGWNGWEPAVRAEIAYATGVIQAAAGARSAAAAEFQRALALSGTRDLRLDAAYDLAHLALEEGEALRAKLPEISGQPPTPSTAPAAAPAGPDHEDPLAAARAAYLEARERFVDRLKLGDPDPDARANVQLVLKRLEELDRIEEQREKQKQEQDKQDQQRKDEQDQQNQDKSEKDPQDKPEKQDKPQDGQNASKDAPEPPEPKPGEDKPAPEPTPPPEKPADAGKDGTEKPPPKPKSAAEPPAMSKEEMTQILDRLRQLEDQAKQLQQQLREARRVKVKKDW